MRTRILLALTALASGFILEGGFLQVGAFVRELFRVLFSLALGAALFGEREHLEQIRALFAGPKGRPQVRERHINKAPGARLIQMADFFFSPKAVEETFKPTVADWRTEYFEALNQKRPLKARWINVRYTYRFLMAMGLSKAFSIVKGVKSVIK